MFNKKRRLENLTEYEYEYNQYTKATLQTQNQQLYDQSVRLISENKWLTGNCTQLTEQLKFYKNQNDALLVKNLQLDVENKHLCVENRQLHDSRNHIHQRLEKMEEFKIKLGHEILVHENTKTQRTHLEKCLTDRNKEIRIQKCLVEERNIEVKRLADVLDTAETVSEAKDIVVKDLQAKIKALERDNQNIIDENNDTMKDLENKNLQLEHDLVERSKKHLEQTITIKAKMDEKEDIIEHLQEAMEEYCKQEDAINLKDTIIENLQKTLNEQFSASEIQNEQNAIYRKEYQDSQAKLIRCSLENRNLRQSFEDGGDWVRKKQEEIAEKEASLKNKEDDLTGLTALLKESESKLIEFERETQDKTVCKVCMEDDISVVFLPCGHLCCCSSCANLPAVKKCPICRVEIGGKIRVFQS